MNIDASISRQIYNEFMIKQIGKHTVMYLLQLQSRKEHEQGIRQPPPLFLQHRFPENGTLRQIYILKAKTI